MPSKVVSLMKINCENCNENWPSQEIVSKFVWHGKTCAWPQRSLKTSFPTCLFSFQLDSTHAICLASKHVCQNSTDFKISFQKRGTPFILIHSLSFFLQRQSTHFFEHSEVKEEIKVKSLTALLTEIGY